MLTSVENTRRRRSLRRMVAPLICTALVAAGMVGVSLGMAAPAGATGPTFVCANDRAEVSTLVGSASGVGPSSLYYSLCVAWNGTYESLSVEVTGTSSDHLIVRPPPLSPFDVHGELFFNGSPINPNVNTSDATQWNQLVKGQVAYWYHGQYCEKIWMYTYWLTSGPPGWISPTQIPLCLNL